jgi:hypothetical protein
MGDLSVETAEMGKQSIRMMVCLAFAVSAVSGCQAQEAGDESSNPARLFPFCEGGKWGYIDRRGKMIVLPRFLKADDFYDGRAWVVTEEGPGFLDERGRMAFMVSTRGPRRFAEGLGSFSAELGLDAKCGYVDRQGKVIIEPKFDDAQDFSGGLAAVNIGAKWWKGFPRPRLQGGKWGFIDKTGRLVIPSEFEYVEIHGFTDGLAQVRVNDRFTYIDKSGKLVLVLEYRSQDPKRWIASAGPFSEGLASVCTSGYGGPYSGFVDQTGRFAIEPQFEAARDFSGGLAAVVAGKKWGYVDRNGRIAIPPQFQDARDFSEGLAAIREGELWSYVDTRGKLVITGPYNDVERFRGGLARVHEGGSFELTHDGPAYWAKGAWFYINRKGRRIRQCCRDEESPGYGREHR